MFKQFFPKLIVKKYSEINLKFLNERNIKGLILDIDNTLVPYSKKEPDDELVKWLNELQAKGIKICLVSNAREQRVKVFNEKLGLLAIHKANKPGVASFNRAIKTLNMQPYQIAVLGDQIFTDIYGGNKTNLFTVLVEPITSKEFFLIKFKRIFEKYVLYRYKKHSMKGIKC